MNTRFVSYKKVVFLLALVFLTIACGLPGRTEGSATETSAAVKKATPTPTVVIGNTAPTPTTEESRCKGLRGNIEMQVLVGPAEIVGLEPVAIGSAPFHTTSDSAPYLVEGGGPIDYSDILTKEWGTYEVTFQMDTTVTGDCAGAPNNETLSLALEANGEQNVIVDAEGFHGEYPWSGSHTFDLAFPLEDEARVEGEGYVFILHLTP